MAHPISDQLAGVADRRERHRVKARAFAGLADQAGRSVTRGRFKVTLLNAPVFADDALTFSVRVDRDGLDVTPADLNPIRVVNPPIQVLDPAGDIVRTSVSPVTGETTTLRYREDLPAALLAIVRELVR